MKSHCYLIIIPLLFEKFLYATAISTCSKHEADSSWNEALIPCTKPIRDIQQTNRDPTAEISISIPEPCSLSSNLVLTPLAPDLGSLVGKLLVGGHSLSFELGTTAKCMFGKDSSGPTENINIGRAKLHCTD